MSEEQRWDCAGGDYMGFRVTGPLDATDLTTRMIYLAIRQNLSFEMPCGATVALTGKDQACPNSGSCSKGFKDCWVERYSEAT